jgi:SNF2 family DNA or RNA helicase
VKIQLPKKTDNIVLCPLTALQKDVYKKLLNLEQVKIILTADDPCPCGSRDENNEPYKRGSCCEQKWTKVRSVVSRKYACRN